MGNSIIVIAFLMAYAVLYGHNKLEKGDWAGVALAILAVLAGIFIIVVKAIFYDI